MRHDDEIARRGVEGDDSWTLTASGLKMVFFRPEIGAINLPDIALQLSRLCRFTGATRVFYSVAQHSILVAQLVKQILDDEGVDNQTVEYWDQILAALFHDAEEAYVNDISSPLKCCMRGKYYWISIGIRRKVFERYGIDWGYHNEIVKAGDNKAVLIERYYLMPDHPEWPKISKEEMRYSKPPVMEHDAARIQFTKVVQMALRMRTNLRNEAASEATGGD